MALSSPMSLLRQNFARVLRPSMVNLLLRRSTLGT
uniref:Uncharacterized protein n=1 Tax=Lepeophtheirus salmonis TaxID=72036 RepID=A0A0K2TR46_LEPSM